MVPLISDPSQITVEWLTAALCEAGIRCRVESFTSKSIGTGQVGENIRFALQGEGVPESVVAKFPSADPISRQTGIAQMNYVREVFFYQHVASTVDVQTPRVLHSDVNEATHDFILLMEDLSPGEQGDQLGGCSVDEAALAMEQLARLQGPRWGDRSLASHPLIGGGYTPEMAARVQELYKMVEPGFLERYRARLTDADLQVVRAVGDNLGRLYSLYEGPWSFIHIDYRLDNMMFGGPYPLAIVDWQSISLGCPMNDASYFMGTSLVPEVRQREERHLLRHYLDTLSAYGVDLDENDCFEAYRNYAPAGLIMAVIASMIVGETARGNDMFMAMATRSLAMCRDLGSL